MAKATAGYSGAPLAKKLGLKPGFVIRLVNPPPHYFELFEAWPEGVKIVPEQTSGKALLHYFATDAKALVRDLPALKSQIAPAGTIWISWPKKASGIATDLTENGVCAAALACGLVDVKVCAIDAVWSGLKLVIPVKDRPAKR